MGRKRQTWRQSKQMGGPSARRAPPTEQQRSRGRWVTDAKLERPVGRSRRRPLVRGRHFFTYLIRLVARLAAHWGRASAHEPVRLSVSQVRLVLRSRAIRRPAPSGKRESRHNCDNKRPGAPAPPPQPEAQLADRQIIFRHRSMAPTREANNTQIGNNELVSEASELGVGPIEMPTAGAKVAVQY